MSTIRQVKQVITSHHKREGGGFVVRRPFPSREVGQLDPILLLDELGPVRYGPGQAVGAPDHPHRGIETVTYLLEGEGSHADSAGHEGTLGPGDVQWMTAGSGVVHREMPSARIRREGGRTHGFQIWVNLPRAHKMTAPRYQELAASTIPVVEADEGRVRGRLIAGDALGVSAITETFVPVVIQHWSLQAGGHLALPVMAEANLGVYLFEGQATVAGEELGEGQFVVLGSGDTLEMGSAQGAELLLLGGQPLEEPIAWGGPFVMNTPEEIQQAYADYRAGRMGTIAR